MNQYHVQFLCGQIKFVEEFFQNYQDEKVITTVKKINKIKAEIQVSTVLSIDETVNHLKTIFKQSSYGAALYFTVQQ